MYLTRHDARSATVRVAQTSGVASERVALYAKSQVEPRTLGTPTLPSYTSRRSARKRRRVPSRPRTSSALCSRRFGESTSHGASLGATELLALGLPVVEIDPTSWEWECIWRLLAFYWVQVRDAIYESAILSYRPFGPQPA